MNEADARFCISCGEPMGPAARFCEHCGTERATLPLPAPPVVSEPLPPPPVGDRTPSPNRNRAIVIGVVMGVVIVAVAGLAYAKSSSSDHKASIAVPAAAPPITLPATTAAPIGATSPTVTPTTSGLGARSVVAQLDAELSESAAQLGELKTIIAQFDPATTGTATQPCGLSGAVAAARTQPIINNRKSLVAGLENLGPTSSGTVRRLVTLLHTALDLSLRSDYAYQAWMTANSSTDASDPCQRAHDANWQSSQAIAPSAGAAKKAFLAAYLPVAAQFGVRADWKYTDF